MSNDTLWEKLAVQEDQLKEAEAEIARLRAEVERETARADAMERAGAEQAKRADENYSVIIALRAENEALQGHLLNMLDTAEYWFNRENMNGISESDYKTWHALGYGSRSYRKAKAALAGRE